ARGCSDLGDLLGGGAGVGVRGYVLECLRPEGPVERGRVRGGVVVMGELRRGGGAGQQQYAGGERCRPGSEAASGADARAGTHGTSWGASDLKETSPPDIAICINMQGHSKLVISSTWASGDVPL